VVAPWQTAPGRRTGSRCPSPSYKVRLGVSK
jgi:hypothetical protein